MKTKLRQDDLDDYLYQFSQFKDAQKNSDNMMLKKVGTLIALYDIKNSGVRQKQALLMMCNMHRILNMRTYYTKEDYEFVEKILQCTDRAVTRNEVKTNIPMDRTEFFNMNDGIDMDSVTKDEINEQNQYPNNNNTDDDFKIPDTHNENSFGDTVGENDFK